MSALTPVHEPQFVVIRPTELKDKSAVVPILDVEYGIEVAVELVPSVRA